MVTPIRALACCSLLGASALAQQPQPLPLVATVPMPHVEGRIGYFSRELRWLFVAARRRGSRPAEIRIYEVV